MSLQSPRTRVLEYLKKLAKERLACCARANPAAKLRRRATGGRARVRVLELARAEGRNRSPASAERRRIHSRVRGRRRRARCASCCNGIRLSLRERDCAGGTTGCTGRRAIPKRCALLLEHGADPNARDVGDNATPLHFAAAHGNLESVRMLLDAGADVHGNGDVHNGDVIGWAAREGNEAVVELLLERAARAITCSRPWRWAIVELVQRWSKRIPSASRAAGRASRTGRRRCMPRSRRPMVSGSSPDGRTTRCWSCSIELGADVEATGRQGPHTARRRHAARRREAMRLLKAAGAKEPQPAPGAGRDSIARR